GFATPASNENIDNPAIAGVDNFADYYDGYALGPDSYEPGYMEVLRRDEADLYVEYAVGGYNDIDWGFWLSSDWQAPFGDTSTLYHNPFNMDLDAVRLNDVIWATVND